MRESITTRVVPLLEWADRNWNYRRATVVPPLSAFCLVLYACALLGAVAAYDASSAANVVPPEVWDELVVYGGPEGDRSPGMSIFFVGLGGVALSVTDAFGRIVYEYLLWVPVSVWSWASYLGYIVVVVVPGINLLWGLAQIRGYINA